MDQTNLQGLTQAQVQERIDRGEVNLNAGVKTRSIKRIFYENIFTLFNAVNVILAIFVLITGSYKNMLFMGVITCNVIIGIVQEIRSKQSTDRLSVLASSHATVIRDGERKEIALDEIVLDDLIVLVRGDQVPADAIVVDGTCDCNESLLTGESDLIPKSQGSELMSGSFISSGSCVAQVIRVGAESYAAKITAEAKKHKKINSEIMNSVNGIIKFVSCIIFPIGALLFARQYFMLGVELNEAILSTVAALVGMIPEGLILLTSTVLAVSVVRLAQSKVLVQQLYCIETLARVDTLCLDKTGTITTGSMIAENVVPIAGSKTPEEDINESLHALSSIVHADENPNETALAIATYCFERNIEVESPVVSIPFSSEKKWSGATLLNGKSYVMGAAQFIMPKDRYEEIREQTEELAKGARVILLARVDGFEQGNLLGTPEPLAFMLIQDEIRSTASQTIGYFKDQGVTVNVISGDDPRTVSGIAKKVGIDGAEDYVDATTLVSEEDIEEAAAKYHVFGRVKPDQKKALVIALQKLGHTVAMTGDGVNDTLALKQADCSVAMASGSDAARNVAQLVLVDNDFASMPKVVAEGRRSINNLQRSASLFLVKTVLSMVMAAIFVFLPWQYPFQPIQMTLVSMFTIGLPSFVLALEPNHDRIKGKFLHNVIVKSLPASITDVITVLAINVIGYKVLGLSYYEISTLCVLLLAWIGIHLIVRISFPFTPIRLALIVVVSVGTALGAFLLPSLFGIAPFTPVMIKTIVIAFTASAIMFHIIYNLFDNWHTRESAALV
ncbi:MAG: cation-translocating P-type ATPase [Coriobacteriales bacterium]|nr:cation-translocating P-type ATPase [Coriobacteriales bacterium]